MIGADMLARSFRAAVCDIDFEWPTVNLLDACRQYGLEIDDVAYLAANENPYGPSPKALAAATESLSLARVYPSPSLRYDELRNEYAEVRDALAAYCGVPADMVMPGPGSETVLRYVTQVFVDPGDEIVTAPESYSGHPWACQIMAADVRYVPLRDYRFDIDAFLATVSDRTKMVWLCSPNNPTGTIITDEELRRLVANVPASTVIVCDQAYQELVDDPSWGDATQLLLEGHRNVVVLRTMSKAFGLAGLRMGHAIADPEVCSLIDRIREPYYISGPSCAATLAAPDDLDWCREVVRKLQAGRRWVTQQLTELDCTVVPSQCNFVLADTGVAAGVMYDRLLRRGVVVRPGDIWGYDTHLRISIGTDEENRRLVAAMAAALAE